MLPLARPALVTLIIVNSLWVWNELLVALVFLPDEELKTLMVGVTLFQGRYSLNVPVLMAGMLVASAPMAAAVPGRPALLHPRPHGRGAQGIGGSTCADSRDGACS